MTNWPLLFFPTSAGALTKTRELSYISRIYVPSHLAGEAEMETDARRARYYRIMAVSSMVVCTLAAIFILAVVSIRLPALVSTKKDILFGTLLALGVSLLIVTNGILINLLIMVRRLTRAPVVAPENRNG